MELRHLRYFVAVAEEGSLTLAAQKRLHTAQPSLSRQIRDLESEVGVPLMTRGAHGIVLTAAGQAFLEHAKLTLAQAQEATEAARRAASPSKPSLAIGVLVGHEVDWLPRSTGLLRSELFSAEIKVSSGFSTTLAHDLQHGILDVAFLRHETDSDLAFKLVEKEPLVAILPNDHPLASCKAVHPRDFVGETFIGISEIPRVLRAVVNGYLSRCGVAIVPHLEIDNFAMAISLVTSTRGVALLPASIKDVLPWSVVSRPLRGEQPTIDLMVGYRRENDSPILRVFLNKLEELLVRMAREPISQPSLRPTGWACRQPVETSVQRR
jgi:LysR family hca operon transcriptional activator